MTEYVVLKWLHVLSSTLLFGTGIGSAYYLLFTSRSGDPRAVLRVASLVVVADWIFTSTTIVLQPLTGWRLAHLAGFPWTSTWLWGSVLLYLLAGACWLPVVAIQIRMRELARTAVAQGTPLPPRYGQLLRWWTALGVPAFLALVLVFWFMVAKPM